MPRRRVFGIAGGESFRIRHASPVVYWTVLFFLLWPPSLTASSSNQFGPLGPSVHISPDGTYEPDRPKNSTGHTAVFVAQNTTNLTQDVSLSCWGTGGVTCTNINPPAWEIPAFSNKNVVVTYSVAGSGGGIYVDIEAGSFYDTGDKVVTTPPSVGIVTPVVTNTPDTAIVRSRTPLLIATYSTADAAIDSSTLVVRFGSDTITPLARYNARLVEWEVEPAQQLSPGTTKELYVRICHVNNGCSSASRYIKLDNSGAPIVSFTGMPLEVHGNGPQVEAAFATPAYYSRGAPRSASLVYSTRQSYPRALVNVDLELTWPAGNPDQIKVVLIDGVVRMDSLVANSPICQASTGRKCRVTLQGDFAGSPFARASRKWLKVEALVTSGLDTRATTDAVEVVLVDRRASPYGSGWFVGGISRLDLAGSDMILVGPSGASSVHRGSGGSYLSPPGDKRSLVWTGTEWHLRFPRAGCGTSAKLVFDAQGLQTKAIDCHGNTTTIANGAADRITSITDPVGKVISFAYDAGLKLTTITDPGGRQTKVSINGSNQLAYDSLASPTANAATSTFAYTTYGLPNSSVVLASQTDAIGQVTTYAYDSRRRPNQVTLPPVLPETGSTPVAGVLKSRPQALRGLDTLLSADSIFAQSIDARGNWLRRVEDRFGSALKVWDALGTISRASYAADGLPTWTEGKIPDSSRIHYTYDSQRRLARVFRLRTAGDTVRIDSLVYDGSHRVIRRVTPLGQAEKFTYNGVGDVIEFVTTSNDTTKYQYHADGLVDKVNAPGQTGWTIYTYETTWKNLYELTKPGGTVLTQNFYDAYGRISDARRKVTVRVLDPEYILPDTMQWRRTRTWYTALNQVDSVRLERTNSCAAPCYTPPSWPLPVDTARWVQVRFAYDRLGRDTTRINTRGYRTRSAYDGLGRLRQHWPFADSVATVDSFRYDIAGNIRYGWTRRGHLIERTYDIRGRDSTMVVPGVGTYRYTYAGPLDQLTRAWVDGFVDSIGGVNPEARWGFSQAGFLLADTMQGTRVTSGKHDRYGRDTSLVDPTGTWRLRYDGVRGLLDSVITPFGDTLSWATDSRWRRLGPYIQNDGDSTVDYEGVPAWDNLGKLISIVASQDTVTVGRWDVDTVNPDIHLLPLWTETRGPGGATVNMQDTLSHDGWGRVTGVSYLKNGTSFATATYSYDRDVNIRPSSETRVYDLASTRLTSRGTDTFSYDRSGNLVSRTAGGATWTYGYDALDRLVSVRQNGSLVARYAYDVLGRRIVKRVYAGAGTGYMRMLYRNGEVIAEADSAGSLTFAYTRGLGTDELVAIRRYSDGTNYHAVLDALGSTRGVTRRDGAWLASWRYTIYGAVIDSAGVAPFALRYRWTGREYDAETGFYYFRSRYYDPGGQRFIQEDPIGYAGGLNLYAYGDGNPTNGRDPDGLVMLPLEGEGQDGGGGNDSYLDGAPMSSRMARAMLGGSRLNRIASVGGGFWGWLDAHVAAVDAHWNTIPPTVSLKGLENALAGIPADVPTEVEGAVTLGEITTASENPTWAGNVPGSTLSNPYPPDIALKGGGRHGHPGVWYLESRGETHVIDFGRGFPRTVLQDQTVGKYEGWFYSPYYGPKRLYAKGYVLPNGWGLFHAYPGTPWQGCNCTW